MKKLLFIAFIVGIFTTTLKAQSTVTVFSKDGEKFWVIINGIKQNAQPQTNVKVTGLNEPNYKFKIIFDDEKIPSIDKMIYTKDVDGKYYNASYIIKKDKKGKYVLQINSIEETTASTPGQYVTPLVLVEQPQQKPNINTNTNTQNTNQTQTTTTIVGGTSTTVNNSNDGGSINMNVVDPITGEAINVNMSVTGGTVDKTTTTTTTTTTITTSTGINTNTNTNTSETKPTTNRTNVQPTQQNIQPNHYVMPGYTGPIGCPWPMSDAEFQSAKASIASKNFEDSKLTVAKQIVNANCLLCSQVKEIMKLFSFESTKLEFAKYAYSKVYDKGNYYKLNDAFSFESSIEELNDYIIGK